MCAIAGVFKLQAGEEILAKLLTTMHHRGPDANGVAVDEDCALLHARLTVIDPAGGAQPMKLTWAGESYTIVYNGELYNTEEIRGALCKLGHTFSGHSDTEVFLHAYAQWGEKMLDMCNGIFAAAIWMKKRKELFLARDRMGVKPLFYKVHNGGFLFASEIKTILAFPTVRAVMDAQGAAEVLLLGPGRTPGSGVLRGIYEIEPGCCGYYRDGKLELRRYWKLRDREHTESFEETTEHVRFLVTDAIRRQMVSDVPIGTFLSGGLDSSIITAVCAGEQQAGNRLRTFSVDYVDNDQYFVPNKFQPNADGHYIRKMQETFDTDHHWCILSPEGLLAVIEDATWARDLPGMADVDFSLLAFCKEIKKEVTVALSGECADEIFGGYPWYRDPAVRSADGFPWAQNTKQRCGMLVDSVRSKIDGEAYIYQRYLDTCRDSDILPGTCAEERRMKEMVNLNMRWFMQTLLDRKDRMSMHSGLEVRVPFCDYRIAEYMYGVPWEFKDYLGKEKGLLRHAMTGILPDEILWRKKSPYPKTHDPKYLELVSVRLKNLLQDQNAPIFQIVQKSALQSILDVDAPWPWYGQLMRKPQTIAYFLQLDAWLRIHNVDISV